MDRGGGGGELLRTPSVRREEHTVTRTIWTAHRLTVMGVKDELFQVLMRRRLRGNAEQAVGHTCPKLRRKV